MGSSRAPLVSIAPPDKPWQLMAMDVMGPMDVTERGNAYILVMGEYSTRYMIAAAIKDQTADTIHEVFTNRIVLTHGVPITTESVLTDQGTNFLSNTMDDLYKQIGVKRMPTTAYRKCCDGLVERFNKTMGDMLASYTSNGRKNWDDYIPYALFAYNTAIHASTDASPHYLMFSRDARESGDVMPPVRNELITDRNMASAKLWHLAQDTARERLIEAQVVQKKNYDKRTKVTEYKVGDRVLLKDLTETRSKFDDRWGGPHTIVQKLSDVNYKLKTDKGKDYVTHVDRLKRSYSTERTTGIREPLHPTQTTVNDVQVEEPTSAIVGNKPTRKPLPKRRVMTRQVKLPAKYKDFVVHTRKK